MRFQSKAAGVVIGIAVLSGCAMQQPAVTQAPLKGEQLDIRNILAAHPNKTGCVDYQAATNSCAQVFTATISGDTMVTQETTALLLAGGGGTQYIETVRRSTLRGGMACTATADLDVTGRDEMSAFVLGETRAALDALGGSACSTYYRSGVGYVASTVGANGQPSERWDVQFQFIVGEARLRAQ